MALELAVWLFADAVGTLSLSEGRLAFQYRAEWLQRPDAVVLNALIGNHDAHAKNFSLLYGGRSPVLAPLYDILCTAAYPDLTPKMAMKIGSKYKFGEVQARHWDQFAEGAGLTRAPCRKRIIELARALPMAARKLQAQAGRGFAGLPLIEQIVSLIEQRAALTLRRLQDNTD